LALGGIEAAYAREPARVRDDDSVPKSGVQDGAQQPVGMYRDDATGVRGDVGDV
jgi:hypothetical protein